MTRRLYYLLAGLEAGVLGGLLGLAWTVISSLWQGRPAWSYLALLGSIADENLIWHREFWLAALAGSALSLISTGVIGALFGLIVRRSENGPRVLLVGLAFGVAAFLSCNTALANRWQWAGNPVSHERTMLVACLLFGGFLGKYPRILRSISTAFPPED